MEDIFRHFADHQVWHKHHTGHSNTPPVMEPLDVTEIWCCHSDDDGSGGSGHVIRQQTVQPSSLRDWLDEPSDNDSASDDDEKAPRGQQRVLRIAWAEPECDVSLNKSLEVILEAWRLREAVNYARSCCAGVAALSPPPSHHHHHHHPLAQSQTRFFAMSYQPKLALAWSHVDSGETRCVALAGPDQRAGLHDVLSSRWHAALGRHAMLPAFAACVMFGHELDATLESIKVEVREVEARTGYHRFSRRSTHQASDGELGDLSARMSGCATKLASGSRKIKMMEILNDFMATHAGPVHGKHDFVNACQPPTTQDELPSASTGADILRHNIALLKHRGTMQAIDTAFVQQRVQTQVAALFHLIAQADNRLAFATARASRSIAESTLRDSASMKMLALVAMFFLPASFVAALFSTPLFDWDAAAASGGSGVGVATRPQFGLFWAIALPLTAGTFLIYAMWMLWQRRERRRNKEEVERLGA